MTRRLAAQIALGLGFVAIVVIIIDIAISGLDGGKAVVLVLGAALILLSILALRKTERR